MDGTTVCIDWHFGMSTESGATLFEYEFEERDQKVSISFAYIDGRCDVVSRLHERMAENLHPPNANEQSKQHENRKKIKWKAFKFNRIPFFMFVQNLIWIQGHFWRISHAFRFYFRWHGFVVWQYTQPTIDAIQWQLVTRKNSIQYYRSLSTINLATFRDSWDFFWQHCSMEHYGKREKKRKRTRKATNDDLWFRYVLFII